MPITISSRNQRLGAAIRKFLAETGLNDLHPGSALLTFLEATADADAEIAGQLINVLEAANLDNLTGTDLVNRAIEFGLDGKLPAQNATGYINITDKRFVKVATSLYLGVTPPIAGQSVLYVNDNITAASIYVGRGTVNYEGPITVSSVVPTGSYYAINLAAPLTYSHFSGESVIAHNALGPRVITAGSLVQVPANNITTAVTYRLLNAATIADGEVELDNVFVVASLAGASGNAGLGQISSFTDATLATNYSVTNPLAFTNGHDIETDDELKDRIRAKVQSLPKGTIQAILFGVNGLFDSVDGKRIVSANISEATDSTRPSTLYIDDGTGFEPSFDDVGTESLVATAIGGERFVQLSKTPITRLQIESGSDGPYSLSGGETLKLVSGGPDVLVGDDSALTKSFSVEDFAVPGNASAIEIVNSINGDVAINGQWIARTSRSGKRIVLTPTDPLTATGQITGGTANDILGFPTCEARPLWLYQNDQLLSQGKVAKIVGTVPASDIKLTAGAYINLGIDLAGGPNDHTFVDSDFLAYGQNVVTASPDNIVKVLNHVWAGATWSIEDGFYTVVSNLGQSDAASLLIFSNSFVVDPLDFFQMNRVTGYTGHITIIAGETKDYTLNRFSGQIEMAVPLTKGDTLTAASDYTGAFIDTSIAVNALDLGVGTNTVNDRFNQLWAFIDDPSAFVVGTPIADAMTASAVFGYNVTNKWKMTFATSGTISALNVKAGDWMLVNQFGNASNSLTNGAWKVLSVAGEVVTLDENLAANFQSFSYFTGDIVFVRSIATPMLAPVTSNNSYFANDLKNEIQSYYSGIKVEVLPSSKLRLTSLNRDPATSALLFVSQGPVSKLGLDKIRVWPQIASHRASAHSSSEINTNTSLEADIQQYGNFYGSAVMPDHSGIIFISPPYNYLPPENPIEVDEDPLNGRTFHSTPYNLGGKYYDGSGSDASNPDASIENSQATGKFIVFNNGNASGRRALINQTSSGALMFPLNIKDQFLGSFNDSSYTLHNPFWFGPKDILSVRTTNLGVTREYNVPMYVSGTFTNAGATQGVDDSGNDIGFGGAPWSGYDFSTYKTFSPYRCNINPIGGAVNNQCFWLETNTLEPKRLASPVFKYPNLQVFGDTAVPKFTMDYANNFAVPTFTLGGGISHFSVAPTNTIWYRDPAPLTLTGTFSGGAGTTFTVTNAADLDKINRGLVTGMYVVATTLGRLPFTAYPADSPPSVSGYTTDRTNSTASVLTLSDDCSIGNNGAATISLVSAPATGKNLRRVAVEYDFLITYDGTVGEVNGRRGSAGGHWTPFTGSNVVICDESDSTVSATMVYGGTFTDGVGSSQICRVIVPRGVWTVGHTFLMSRSGPQDLVPLGTHFTLGAVPRISGGSPSAGLGSVTTGMIATLPDYVNIGTNHFHDKCVGRIYELASDYFCIDSESFTEDDGYGWSNFAAAPEEGVAANGGTTTFVINSLDGNTANAFISAVNAQGVFTGHLPAGSDGTGIIALSSYDTTNNVMHLASPQWFGGQSLGFGAQAPSPDITNVGMKFSLVPQTASDVVNHLNKLQISSLSIDANIERTEDGRVNINAKNLGASSAIEVFGGTANGVTATLIDSPILMAGEATSQPYEQGDMVKMPIATFNAGGFHSREAVNVTNNKVLPKLAGINNLSQYLASTVTVDVAINTPATGFTTFTFKDTVTPISVANTNLAPYATPSAPFEVIKLADGFTRIQNRGVVGLIGTTHTASTDVTAITPDTSLLHTGMYMFGANNPGTFRKISVIDNANEIHLTGNWGTGLVGEKLLFMDPNFDGIHEDDWLYLHDSGTSNTNAFGINNLSLKAIKIYRVHRFNPAVVDSPKNFAVALDVLTSDYTGSYGVIAAGTNNFSTYPYHNLVIGDKLNIGPGVGSWFKNGNLGTWTICNAVVGSTLWQGIKTSLVMGVEKVALIVRADPGHVSQNAVALTNNTKNLFFLEGKPYDGVRRVANVEKIDGNTTNVYLYQSPTNVPPSYAIGTTSLTVRDRLNFTNGAGKNGYTYFTGLLQETQRTVDGLDSDQISYPGLKATGTQIEVFPPQVFTPEFSVTVVLKGATLAATIDRIRSAVMSYVNSLGLGELVVFSKIVEFIHQSVNAVAQVAVTSPSGVNSIQLLPSQKALAVAQNISVVESI